MVPPEADWCEALGGEAGVRRLVDRFYDEMDREPTAAGLRGLHTADLTASRTKLWMFLVGRFGGPNLYVERYGHPRLRARHMPFAIGTAEADQWVACMDTALAEHGADPELVLALRMFFRQVADHMVNQPG